MSDPNNNPSSPDIEEDAGSEMVVDATVSEPAEGRDEGASSLEAERDAFRDTAMRLQADFENYRKRMLKQQAETAERANESFALKLLPVLDTVELALAHEPNGVLEQVGSALREALVKEGLERIESVDAAFDPTLHEAVAHEDGEGGPRVSEELRAGYRWKGRVIRPAMVKVVG